MPLTLRPAALTKHGGQISLPGGAVDERESTADTALRELREELGPVESVELLQQLSDSYVYVSDFLVTPWLAATSIEPEWRPHASEVERVVEFPLETLLDPTRVGTVEIERGPRSFRAPCLWFGDDYIWGATSIILGQLAGALRNILDPPS